MILLLRRKLKVFSCVLFCGAWLNHSVSATPFDERPEHLSPFSLSLKDVRQERTISGTVKGDDGEALPGASVVIKGTTTGTTTDANGSFSLSYRDNTSILVISFIGYALQEITIGNQSSINVILVPDMSTLDEVVITGYGELKKSDFTGASSSVKGEELTQLPTQRVDQALQGRAAGVQVINTDGSPGGNTTIRIRGSNSVNGSNAALIVIDGLQGADLRSLNPNDIESIEVLKDASATAIYGSQGANGVIVITTKKGRSGPPVFNYNFSYGVQQLRKKLDLMNAVDFANTTNDFRASQPASTPIFTPQDIEGFKANGGTDWQDEIYRTGAMQNHQLSISGASDKVSYFVSGGYLDQKGILINSQYKRYSLRTNVNVKINDWAAFGLTYVGTKEIGNTPPFGEGSGNVDPLGQTTGTAPRWAPTVSVYDALGNYILKHPSGYGAVDSHNPVAAALEPVVENNTMRNMLNTYLEFKPLKDLTLRISGGATLQNTNEYRFFNEFTKAGGTTDPPGSARLVAGTFARYQNTNMLTYDKTVDKHHVTITGVIEANIQDIKKYQIDGTGYVNQITGVNDFGAANSVTASSSVVKRVLNSYVGRVNYSFADKYAIMASYRADGASVFGANNKWGYFPSVGAAWSASEENFIKDLNLFSTLKLRGSWGITGNQSINPYQTIEQLTSIDPDGLPLKYPYNGQSQSETAYYLTLPNNPDLKWESTRQINVGLDFGLFDERITGSVELYKKTTNDLLLGFTVPTYTGYSSITRNVGSIENKGIEISIGGHPLAGAVKWSTNVTYTSNRSKVLDLGEVKSIPFRTTTGGGYNFSNSGRALMNLTVGHPLGEMTGYGVLGTWSTAEAEQAHTFGQVPGDQKYEDVVKDGIIDAKDLKPIGQALPKFYFGWTNTISYKNFDLNFLIQGSYGNDLFNGGRVRLERPGEGTSAALSDRWTPEHQDTDVPAFNKVSDRAPYPKGNLTSRLRITSSQGSPTDQRLSRWVEDASYIRLKNITLAYNLPKSLVGSRISKLRIYASAANLATITKYTGYDPETSSFNNNDARAGIDFSNYPTAKTYTFGLDLTF